MRNLLQERSACGNINGFPQLHQESEMGNKIVTEADRKATPPLPGAPRIKQGDGQRRSQERGSHIRNKKRPGKRPHQG